MPAPLPAPYAGRNSPKDVANRLWDVEGTRLPAIQAELDQTRADLAEELDLPDFTLILQNAMT